MGQEHRNKGADVDYRFGAGPIADLDNPTVAEIVGLTDISCELVPGSPAQASRSAGRAAIHGLCDNEAAYIASLTDQANITGSAFRELGGSGTDATWVLFDDSNKSRQYLVRCWTGFTGTSGDPQAGDVIDIHPVQVGSRSPVAGTNTGSDSDVNTFDFELVPNGAPKWGVTIVA